MRLLLDANIPRSAFKMLIEMGHDVLDIRDTDLAHSCDQDIYTLAQSESRILVTRDLDFANILLYPPSAHPGIIVLRMGPAPASVITEKLRTFLKNVSARHIDIAHSIVILQSQRYRVRR